MSASRPPFWRIPRARRQDDDVLPGSPAEGHLQRGDTIMRIQNRDSSTMTHLEAHDAFTNAGNQISMTVHRGKQQLQTPLISQMAGAVSPSASPRGDANKTNPYLEHPADLLPAVHLKETMQHQQESHYELHQQRQVFSGPSTLPRTVSSAARKLSDGGIHYTGRSNDYVLDGWHKELEKQAIHHQAYRTLPLITPGVKVKRDLPIGSYLRFQYDPKAGRPKLDGDQYGFEAHNIVADIITQAAAGNDDATMKQKVANAVTNMAATKHSTLAGAEESKNVANKPLSSPMDLCSKENIQKAAQEQAGLTAPGIPLPKHYDPMKSPTYHALQEIEDRTEQKPVHTRVYAVPTPPAHKDHMNALGVAEGKILQSYSFNRVMMDVLGESTL